MLVIGGGPGGMEAAIIAAERGHEVELWERTARLGGALLAAGGPVFKKDVLDYAEYLVNKTHRSDATVKTMKTATAAEVLAGNWDKVILAAGSRATIPPIKGIDGPNVVLANDVLTGKAKFGKKVVVLGAGLVGAETAAHCKTEGAEQVTVIEMLPQRLMTVEHCRNNEQALDQLLADTEVEFITSAKLTEFGDGIVTYEVDGTEHHLVTDTSIIASGYTSNNELFDELIEHVDVEMVGDVIEPDSILTAVHGGFHIARNI
ncbi:FAD-dependent oxidoreductase [Aestuariimicrobium sp. Y1814]|uniref:FAD-dependent oxidoreductase n=1 Tax=Aestuariimicrobium sp. Y1814 TaxID=3418742 RepID=UPI003DA6DDF5